MLLHHVGTLEIEVGRVRLDHDRILAIPVA
jgi:hypothetical protein